MRRTLQRDFNKQIKRAPVYMLARIFSPKFKAAGVRSFRKAAHEMAEHVIANGDSPFTFSFGASDREIQISFDEADSAELQRLQDRFIDELPDLIQRVMLAAANIMVATSIQQWRVHRYVEIRQLQHFRLRLEDRWGEGLDLLRVLVELCCQAGQDFHNQTSNSRARKNKALRTALSRLHVRSCQVASETLSLLENGFSDGAIARWRTLHEITTVAQVIDDGGDDLAKRYLAYDIVERKKALDQYVIDHDLLGFAPPSKREITRINRLFEASLDEYGAEFGKSYGWASNYLNLKSPRFVDIQKAAGRAMMQSHYKMASYNVHATPRALSFRLGSVNESDNLIAGASNAGLDEPGQSLAFSLVQITALLFRATYGLDDMVSLQAMSQIRDKAVDALIRIGKELKREDREIRRVLDEQGLQGEIV